MRYAISRGALAGCLLLLTGFVSVAAFGQPVMTAHYIDVGQADVTLLEFPCGAILIGAGSQNLDYTQGMLDESRGK